MGFCLAVVKRLSDMCLLPHPVDQLTINEYQPGVGIAFHVDAHSAFEDGIAALTLGSGIVMELRQPQPDGSGKVSVGKHHRLAPPPEDSGQVVQKKCVAACQLFTHSPWGGTLQMATWHCVAKD